MDLLEHEWRSCLFSTRPVRPVPAARVFFLSLINTAVSLRWFAAVKHTVTGGKVDTVDTVDTAVTPPHLDPQSHTLHTSSLRIKPFPFSQRWSQRRPWGGGVQWGFSTAAHPGGPASQQSAEEQNVCQFGCRFGPASAGGGQSRGRR